MHDLHGIQWRGFAEFNYKVFNQRAPELGTFGFEGGSAGSFYTGDFDLQLTSRINERTGILAEIALGEGDAQTFDVDLERVFLKYDHGNHFSLMLGRYHTAVGYYNRAFESGCNCNWHSPSEYLMRMGDIPVAELAISRARGFSLCRP